MEQGITEFELFLSCLNTELHWAKRKKTITTYLYANLLLDVRKSRSVGQFKVMVNKRYRSFELLRINKMIEDSVVKMSLKRQKMNKDLEK